MAVPKGVRTRNTPDWFARYLSTVAVYVDNNPDPQTHWWAASLYNNAPNNYLFVYAIDHADEFSYMARLCRVVGTLGSFFATGSRINPSEAAPPGQGYLLDNGNVPSGGSAFTTGEYSAICTDFSKGWSIISPLAIIPPNYSLAVAGQFNEANTVTAFWYIPMQDASGRTPN